MAWPEGSVPHIRPNALRSVAVEGSSKSHTVSSTGTTVERPAESTRISPR